MNIIYISNLPFFQVAISLLVANKSYSDLVGFWADCIQSSFKSSEQWQLEKDIRTMSSGM